MSGSRRKRAAASVLLAAVVISATVWGYLMDRDPAGSVKRSFPGIPDDLALTDETHDAALHEYVWSDEARSIRVRESRDVDAAQAGELMEARSHLFEALFETFRPPYPGFVDNGMTRCPPDLLPRKSSVNTTDMWRIGYATTANRRYVIGGCTTETTELMAAYVIVYCADRRVFYEAWYFSERDGHGAAPEVFIEAVRCGY